MNRDEGSYQLSHIYDCLLSATVTPGGQLFRLYDPSIFNQLKKQLINCLIN